MRKTVDCRPNSATFAWRTISEETDGKSPMNPSNSILQGHSPIVKAIRERASIGLYWPIRARIVERGGRMWIIVCCSQTKAFASECVKFAYWEFVFLPRSVGHAVEHQCERVSAMTWGNATGWIACWTADDERERPMPPFSSSLKRSPSLEQTGRVSMWDQKRSARENRQMATGVWYAPVVFLMFWRRG